MDYDNDRKWYVPVKLRNVYLNGFSLGLLMGTVIAVIVMAIVGLYVQ